MTADFFVTNFSERTNQSFERVGSERAPTMCSTLSWGVEVSGLDAVTLIKYPNVGPSDITELDIIEVVGTGQVSRLHVVARLSGTFPVTWSNRMDLDAGGLGEASEPVRRLDQMPADLAEVVYNITGDPIDGFVMVERS